MKKVSKAMYGKSMMKSGGSSKMKKYGMGGPKDELAPLKPNTPKSTTPTGGSSKQTGAPVPVDRIKRKGGPVKKYDEGGKTGIFSRIFKGKAQAKEAPGSPAVPKNQQLSPSTTTPKPQSTPPTISRKIDKVAKRLAKGKVGRSYKTGGMVNSNAKVFASKVAKGRPAKSMSPKKANP